MEQKVSPQHIVFGQDRSPNMTEIDLWTGGVFW